MNKNENMLGQAVARTEPTTVPPNIDLQKLRELEILAAKARRSALLKLAILEAERLPQTLQLLDRLEEEIEKEVITPEQKIIFYSAVQRKLNAGCDFLDNGEQNFIEGKDTTSRLDKLQKERSAPMMNENVDRVKLNEIKSAVENAIRLKVNDRK